MDNIKMFFHHSYSYSVIAIRYSKPNNSAKIWQYSTENTFSLNNEISFQKLHHVILQSTSGTKYI
uniref:Uncharacterized protein n=1 Tax=Anguilla anguilla TaxID=7936 RepID=A0A0E9VXE6_ANGAN